MKNASLSPAPKHPKASARKQKLAQALRRNLQRRKATSRNDAMVMQERSEGER